MNGKFKLYLEYPETFFPTMDNAIKLLASEYRGVIVGSGLGLGFRDIEIEFEFLKNLEAFKTRLKGKVKFL